MSDEQRIVIAAAFGAAVFLYYFFVLFLGGKSRRNRFKLKAEKDSSVTQGEITGILDAAGGEKAAEYRYTVNGAGYTKKALLDSAAGEPPAQVTVYYSAGNPRKAYADFEIARKVPVKTGLTGAVALALAAVCAAFCALKAVGCIMK